MADPHAQRLSRMRRAIAKSMTASALVPQFTIERDAHLRVLGNWREQTEARGVRVSYADVVIAATARALRLHQALNSSFSEDGIISHEEINIGVALDMPDGLIAPAIRRADVCTLPELIAERERLVAAASDQRLGPDELLYTTFTISNLGPLGVRRFRALVVPPQSAILALGALTGEHEMSLSLSCDHRVVDGAPAARFLAELIGLLERPVWLNELISERP